MPTIIEVETPPESAAPPLKEAEIIVLMEDLRAMQEKAIELAAQQLELTKQLEVALKKARELHQQAKVERNDVGGEA